MKCHKFNLVEIALATAVIGIGLSSVLLLFPVGVNAGKSAVADNNMGDIAETIFGYFQNAFQNDWKKDGKNTIIKNCKEFKTDVDDNDVANLENFVDKDGKLTGKVGNSQNLYYSSTKDCYLFRQFTADNDDPNDRTKDIVEFEAIIRCGYVTGNVTKIFYPKANGSWEQLESSSRSEFLNEKESKGRQLDNIYGTNDQEIVKKMFFPLNVEISWPADVPWSKREKRYFRLDVFNEKFEAYPEPSGT